MYVRVFLTMDISIAISPVASLFICVCVTYILEYLFELHSNSMLNACLPSLVNAVNIVSMCYLLLFMIVIFNYKSVNNVIIFLKGLLWYYGVSTLLLAIFQPYSMGGEEVFDEMHVSTIVIYLRCGRSSSSSL